MSDSLPDANADNLTRSGLEPELGGLLREHSQDGRTGFEPELGGVNRQTGVYVDEITCIGCCHCAHVARNTFYIEPDYGRSRAIRQDGDSAELIQEAIDTCPVDCIHWMDYTQLAQLEDERQYQVVPTAGMPIERSTVAYLSGKLKAQRRKTGNHPHP
jgi:ferredoxin